MKSPSDIPEPNLPGERFEGSLKDLPSVSQGIRKPHIRARGALVFEEDLNVARGHLEARRPQEAERLLRKLVDDADQLLGRSEARSRDDWLLLATAHTLLGRALGRMSRADAGEKEFAAALELFERWHPGTGELAVDSLNDYGVALLRAGRTLDALGVFREAVDLGGADAETYRYLADALFNEQNLREAEVHLRHAVELDAENFYGYRDLARVLDADGRTEDAVRTLLSGVVRVAFDDLEAKLALLQEAARIEPGNRDVALELARVLRGLGRPLDAIDVLTSGIAHSPDDALLPLELAELWVGQNAPEKALEMIETVLVREPSSAEALCARAVTLALLDRGEEALGSLDEALASRPDYPFALVMKSELLRARGDVAESLAAAEGALELEPENMMALGAKGAALSLLDRHQEALEFLERAVSLHPDYVFGLRTKGVVLHVLGRQEEALEALDAVLQREPQEAFALSMKGRMLAASPGREGDAVQVLRAAIELRPTATESLLELADLMRRQGENREAIELANRVLSLEPDNVVALGTKGAALMDLGRNEEAVTALVRAVSIDPTYVWGLRALGIAIRLLGRSEIEGREQEVVAALRRAVELRPTDQDLLVELADLLHRLARYDEAIAVADDVLALASDNVSALGIKGASLFWVDRHDDALENLDRAVSLDPAYSFGLDMLGRVLMTLGRQEDAAAVFQRAIQLTPQSVSLWNLRSASLAALGRYTEALEAVSIVLEVSPENTDALRRKAYCLLVLNRQDEARETVQAALAVAPESGELLADMCYLLTLAEDYETARQFADRALAAGPHDAWVQTTVGRYWIFIAEYQLAHHHLEEALQADPGRALTLALKGLTLWELARQDTAAGRQSERATQAEEAFREAIRLDPSDLTYRVGLADVLLELGKLDKARHEYQTVVDGLQKTIDIATTDDLDMAGWCHYRLRAYANAARLFVAALSSSDRIRLASRFNLALVTAVNGQYELSLSEYRRGVEEAMGKQALGRKGDLQRAIADLLEARRLYLSPTEPLADEPRHRWKWGQSRARGEAATAAREPREITQVLDLLREALDEACRAAGLPTPSAEAGG